jgi:5-methyltetrahydrofolate--homocysteine methyltransferase
MAERVGPLMDLGVAIIGGCCGTTPDHIRAIRSAIDAHNAS